MASIVLFLLVACHKPVFETVITRVPPSSPEGQACVSTCATTRDACVKKAKSLHHMGENQAAQMYAQCMSTRGAKVSPTRYGPAINAVGCVKTPCFDTQPRCIKIHDTCFTECGGTVHTEKRCVKNCEE